MNRYVNSKILKTDTGKQYYSTTLFPYADPTSADIYIITTKGDRLDLLASKYYNDVTAWPVIAIANDLSIGSFKLPGGIQIRIPSNLADFKLKLEQLNG